MDAKYLDQRKNDKHSPSENLLVLCMKILQYDLLFDSTELLWMQLLDCSSVIC